MTLNTVPEVTIKNTHTRNKSTILTVVNFYSVTPQLYIP